MSRLELVSKPVMGGTANVTNQWCGRCFIGRLARVKILRLARHGRPRLCRHRRSPRAQDYTTDDHDVEALVGVRRRERTRALGEARGGGGASCELMAQHEPDVPSRQKTAQPRGHKGRRSCADWGATTQCHDKLLVD